MSHTKIVSFWTLANGACFSFNGKAYSKINNKQGRSHSNNELANFEEENQVEVVNNYQF